MKGCATRYFTLNCRPILETLPITGHGSGITMKHGSVKEQEIIIVIMKITTARLTTG